MTQFKYCPASTAMMAGLDAVIDARPARAIVGFRGCPAKVRA
jgi:hypothetical protein